MEDLALIPMNFSLWSQLSFCQNHIYHFLSFPLSKNLPKVQIAFRHLWRRHIFIHSNLLDAHSTVMLANSPIAYKIKKTLGYMLFLCFTLCWRFTECCMWHLLSTHTVQMKDNVNTDREQRVRGAKRSAHKPFLDKLFQNFLLPGACLNYSAVSLLRQTSPLAV